MRKLKIMEHISLDGVIQHSRRSCGLPLLGTAVIALHGSSTRHTD